MRIATFICISAVALAVVIGQASAAAQSLASEDASVTSAVAVQAAPVAVSFETLRGVDAVPMGSGEMATVRGMHVHFISPGNGKFHFAGNPGNNGIGTGNWYNNGSDESVINGELVAPSYHGLCKAGPIMIPNIGPGGVATLDQCP